MFHFQIQFAYEWSGWLLFLLIPALAVPFFFHFRVEKKFRRTRNRIISLVLYVAVAVFSVSALSGMIFTYQVENPENTILLLVDVSDTEEQSARQRDEFVHNLLENSKYDGYKVGVVTFGFTQQYAVPFTYDIEGIYELYLQAERPDTSATDIAAAFRYCRELIGETESSKIVLVTDGKETDESALSAIGAVVAQGIVVDTVYIPSEYGEDYVQVMDVSFPDYHVNLYEECAIGVTLQSKTDMDSVVVELLDNGNLSEENVVSLDLKSGIQTVNFRVLFESDGLHEIHIRVRNTEDDLLQNNEFISYLYLELYNHVLIFERYEGQSEALCELLEQQEPGYIADVVNIMDADAVPTDVDALRKYDQVILNNISNSDLPEGFDHLLYSYVNDFGGGLFTVGGSDENGDAHAYNRSDLNGTLYQQMLPVQAIDYTPPVGVVIIIDVSSSMDSTTSEGYTRKELAKQGAITCLDALTERDYVGVMTLTSVYEMVLPMTRRTQENTIREAILGIEGTGGTVFSDAIDRAGQALTDLETVDRRHIIIVTDGAPSGSDAQTYLERADQNYKNHGITLSVVGIEIFPNSTAEADMNRLVEVGHGRLHLISDKMSEIAREVRADLDVPEIKEVVDEPFYPIITNELSVLFNGVDYGTDIENRRSLNVRLGGFYGVKIRPDAELLLVGEYDVPIYAQWKFGKGSVGSFMSDLNGRWSADFLADSGGRRLILNVIANLMPTQNIRPTDIRFELREGNYINQMSIYTELEEGETIRGELFCVSGEEETLSMNEVTDSPGDLSCYVTLNIGAENRYSRCNFVVKKSGIYRITLYKCDAAGNVISSVQTYKSFSYSEEYDVFREEKGDPVQMLSELAEHGKGKMVADLDDPWEIFENFVTALDRSFDPRFLFMILAMVAFLLDIVVRKFKFKWPHELIRDYKQRKKMQ